MSYALPISRPSIPGSTTLKRKRKGVHESLPVNRANSSPSPPTIVETNVEYTAVINSHERTQRRLAGQRLDREPPPYPFPHKPVRSKQPSGSEQSELDNHPPFRQLISPRSDTSTSTSLRVQHLSTLTALLHQLLQRHDYARASRALSLLLRTDIHGHAIDIRNGGLWQIGAEILLHENGGSVRTSFSNVKTFYDRLALQYAWHRTWPSITNAQDFKLAMFGLWIWVTVQESRRLQGSPQRPGDDMNETELIDSGDRTREAKDLYILAKRYELSEAEKITREMDSLMTTIPFVDDPELIRLRGMVALWMADLIETVEGAEEKEGEEEESADSEAEVEDMDQAFRSQTYGVEAEDGTLEDLISSTRDTQATLDQGTRAQTARDTAARLFARLERPCNTGDEDGNTYY